MSDIIISNATPIISLLKIKKLDILKDLFGEIIIPYEVYCEITNYSALKKDYLDIRELNWIQYRKVKDSDKVNYLLTELDRGEAEVIVLGKELNAKLLLIDEFMARKIATIMKLNIKGIIGCLVLAKEQGIIKTVKNIIIEMQEKDIWFDDELLEEVYKKVNE